MAYELKQGNGGHGLEVYNTKTGKYAGLSIKDSDGNEYENWDAFRDDYLKSIKEQAKKEGYEIDDDVLKDIEKDLFESYKTYLQQAVDKKNGEEGDIKVEIEGKTYEDWESLLNAMLNSVGISLNDLSEEEKQEAIEMAKSAFDEAYQEAIGGVPSFIGNVDKLVEDGHKIFTTRVAMEILNNDNYYEKDAFGNITELKSFLSSTPGKENGRAVGLMATLVNNSRYKKTRCRPITEEEFYEKTKVKPGDNVQHDYSNYMREQYLPIFRGLEYIDDEANAREGFFTKDDSKYEKTLLGSGVYGWIGYFSMSNSYSRDYTNRGFFTKSYVEPQKLKIFDTVNNPQIQREYDEFIAKRGVFTANVKRTLTKQGLGDNRVAAIINDLEKSLNERNDDHRQSFVAQLLGYDARVPSYSNQFDILNFDCVNMVKENI